MPVQRSAVVAFSVLMSLALVSSHAAAENDSLLVLDKAPPKKLTLSKRFKGTGIRGKELASVGARHRLGVAQLQMRLSPAVAVRGGAGMAKLRPQGFLPETKGTAIAAGVSLTLWNNDYVQLDVDVNAVRIGYDSGTLADTMVMLALKNR